MLDDTGLGAIVFSHLQQGLLTNTYLEGNVPPESRAATSPFLSPSQVTDVYLERARALKEIARQRGQSLAQLAVSWVLRHPQITSALIGASSVRQLEDNVNAAHAIALEEEQLRAIDVYAVDGTGFR